MTLGRTAQFNNRLSAVWKWILSFRKSEWGLSDYPVRISVQEQNSESSRRVPRYAADIINWYLAGTGDTVEEALDDLRKTLEEAKREKAREGKRLPRPGTRVPISFASTELISKHPKLSEDFIQRVLELEWAWLSDESSLRDFHAAETNDRLTAKIKEIYDVDVSDIESAKLWEILDRISSRKPSSR